jgi:hypothetical protein
VLALQGYTSDIASLIESLPETVQGFLVWPSPDNMAYFQITILESGFFDGFHYAWCFDIDRSRIHRWYDYHVYTAYDKLPPDIMEFPENLDLVNWILNKEFVGKQAPSGGIYTYGDVQHAVWTLLEGRSTNYSKGPWDIERATGIIESAKAEGEGFIPACNEKFLLILVPLNPHNILHWQSIGMVIPAAPCVPTYSIETAWAFAWNVAWYSIGPGLSISIR